MGNEMLRSGGGGDRDRLKPDQKKVDSLNSTPASYPPCSWPSLSVVGEHVGQLHLLANYESWVLSCPVPHSNNLYGRATLCMQKYSIIDVHFEHGHPSRDLILDFGNLGT